MLRDTRYRALQGMYQYLAQEETNEGDGSQAPAELQVPTSPEFVKRRLFGGQRLFGRFSSVIDNMVASRYIARIDAMITLGMTNRAGSDWQDSMKLLRGYRSFGCAFGLDCFPSWFYVSLVTKMMQDYIHRRPVSQLSMSSEVEYRHVYKVCLRALPMSVCALLLRISHVS